MWRVVTHPGQNVEAILQPGTFLHRLLQTSRIRILGGFQGLDLCRNSLDPKLLKNKTIMYLKIKTEKDSKTSKQRRRLLWGFILTLCCVNFVLIVH